MAFCRAAFTSGALIPGLTSAFTFAVTSSMLWRVLSDMLGTFSSSA